MEAAICDVWVSNAASIFYMLSELLMSGKPYARRSRQSDGARLGPCIMTLKMDGQGSLFEQLARALKSQILNGGYEPGSRLPATRTLAAALGVSRNTVLGAYEILCAEQLAIAHSSSCTRVTSLAPKHGSRELCGTTRAQSRYSARTRKLSAATLARAKSRPIYDLNYSDTLVRPQLFSSWRRKLAAAAIRSGPRYFSPAGFQPLRCAIANYLLRRRGVACSPADIIVVSGTQQALTLVARAVLDEGQSAVIEDPHYELTKHALVAHGANLVRVRVDNDGLVTADLPTRAPKLVYVTPSHQFPSGAVLSLHRRIELLKYAASHSCWVFEDDYYGEYQYDSRPVAALRSLDVAERVIYAGSFSKTLFPGLRLGYVVCPAALRDDLLMAKTFDDLGCSSIEQAALATFLESRQYERHLRKSLAELRNRRETLLDALSRHFGANIKISASAGGVHLVVWFPHLGYTNLRRLIERASERGLGLYAIHPFYQTPPPRPGLLIGFAGLTSEQLNAATALLASCLKDVVGCSLDYGASGRAVKSFS
jgi:GntR family transcriptional regulator / MocR family aminotransferase